MSLLRGEVKIIVCDSEGNLKCGNDAVEYEQEAWSGLFYVLCHSEKMVPKGIECPISTEEWHELGEYIYDSKEEAIAAWNRRDGDIYGK